MTDFTAHSRPVARGPHRCEYCTITIPARTRYHRRTGKYDGTFFSQATCDECEQLMADLFAAGHWSEGAYGEECLPYLPEVDWPDVRAISEEWSARVDAYFARASRRGEWS